MRLKDAPIQRKLMSVIMLTSMVVLLLMGSAYILLEFYSYREALKSNTATLASVIALNSSAALAFDSPKDATENLNALRAEKHIVAACLYDNSGKLFARYPTDTAAGTFPPPSDRYELAFDGGYLSGFQPVFQNGEKLGTLYIRSDLQAMYDQLRRYMMIAMLLIAGSLVVAYLLSKLLQQTISEPILALEQTAKKISERGDYTVRAVKSGNDEVGALTDAFNQMLVQIHAQNDEIRSFSQKLEIKVNERTHALRQQRDFVETIINSSVDLIAVFDMELRYIMLNKRALDFYNMRTEQIIGQYAADIFPQIRESGMLTDLNRALNGEYVHNEKYRSPIVKRSFENFYIPLKDNDGKVYGVLTIGHDISNILEANEKLEMVNTKLLKSNRDLEQFAYVASHDLQEPLRKIQTFSNLLADNFNDEKQLRRYQEKIIQSSFRMQQLIQDVLNFSRISNSEDAFIQVDLNLILAQLKTDFELLLREKQGVINYPKLPVIRGVPLQLSQLFSNLISNSLKYSELPPVIDITYENLSLEEVKKHPRLNFLQPYIRIVFRDNGIGFEPEYSEKIFTIFQRLHGRQSYSGTGIGLALCRKIVENHNGLIYATAEPGAGATFTIILPS